MKYLLSILCLFMFSCTSSNDDSNFELSSSLLDDCNSNDKNFVIYKNNEYNCNDLEILGDFIISNYSLQLNDISIKNIIDGYDDMNPPEYHHVLSSSWQDGSLIELRIFFDLTTIPSSINELDQLQGLDLGDFNQINSFEPNLCDLINLHHLDLSRNYIIEIPECISNLINLMDLDLDENQINTIPESLCEVANNNCYIELDSNNLCDELNFQCFIGNTWDFNGERPQDQSNCCEGPNGEPNWTKCP